jgi:hypothetical protein
VTELVQPLVASAEESPAARHAPTFTELVYAHYKWWRALAANGETDPRFAEIRT